MNLKKRNKDYRSQRRTTTITLLPIARHQYKEFVVRLSLLLYSRVNCGFLVVVKILKIVNDAFAGILGRILSRNTIENWVKKCGLDIYNSPKISQKSVGYAMIVDESMMIGSEKLLLTLGVPAEHTGASLIDELSEVMGCIGRIEKDCKLSGLSEETIKRCIENIQGTLFKGNSRQRTLAEAIRGFLLEEGKIIENENSVHNNSSDILEYTFGKYKQKKSPNKLYGVTSFILFIPAYTQFSSEKNMKTYSFGKHLENVRLYQIEEWAKSYLTQNLVTKRINTLKNAG